MEVSYRAPRSGCEGVCVRGGGGGARLGLEASNYKCLYSMMCNRGASNQL